MVMKRTDWNRFHRRTQAITTLAYRPVIGSARK